MSVESQLIHATAGKPGKIQMSVVEEFELAPFSPACAEGFVGAEYRTDEDRDALMGPLMVAAACVKKRG